MTIAAASQPDKYRSIFAPNEYWKEKTGHPIMWSAPIVAWRSWVDEDRARAASYVKATHEAIAWLKVGKNIDASIKKFGVLSGVKNKAQAAVYRKWLGEGKIFRGRWDRETIDAQWKFLEMAAKRGVLGKVPAKEKVALILE